MLELRRALLRLQPHGYDRMQLDLASMKLTSHISLVWLNLLFLQILIGVWVAARKPILLRTVAESVNLDSNTPRIEDPRGQLLNRTLKGVTTKYLKLEEAIKRKLTTKDDGSVYRKLTKASRINDSVALLEIEDRPQRSMQQTSNIQNVATNLGNLQTVFNVVGNLSPPTNSTPGILLLTNLLQRIIPQNVRTEIVEAIPEDTFGSIRKFFWNTAIQKFPLYLNKTQEAEQNLPDAFKRYRQDATEGVKMYNQLATWLYRAPFSFIDALIAAEDPVYVPINIIRGDYTDQRNIVLNAIRDKQNAFYEPASNASALVAENLQYVVDKINEDQTPRVHPINTGVTSTNAIVNGILAASTSGVASFQVCLINPICCSAPELCAPQVIDPLYSR